MESRKKSKNYNKVLLSFFIPTVLVMILAVIYFSHKGKLKCLSYQFNGKVDSIYYDIKGIATIKVNGIFYDLAYPNWDFDHNRIQKGDSVIKNKNSLTIKLIKHNGQIIIEGE
jgi:hypothetical protein